MSHPLSSIRRRRHRAFTVSFVAAAALALVAMAGLALAKSFTVNVRKNVKVTNNATQKTSSQRIVVNNKNVSVYYLGGETTKHALCTKAKGCFSFWPPYTVAKGTKLTKAKGVPRGKLSLWHRNGFYQVVLGTHPLYRFAPDNNKPGVATGDHITSFGGTWHVMKAASSGSPGFY